MKKIKLSDGKVVQMRSPKVRDVRAVGHIKDPEEREYNLISNLTGMSLDEIDDLEVKDFTKLDEELQSFF